MSQDQWMVRVMRDAIAAERPRIRLAEAKVRASMIDAAFQADLLANADHIAASDLSQSQKIAGLVALERAGNEKTRLAIKRAVARLKKRLD